ncbi:MAG: hypothetical protein R8K20_05085 [Gallionellaceae bacterium]
MLNDNSKGLLEVLEAKYTAMLDMVNDIAIINMKDTRERAKLEKYIFMQRQGIHEVASKLSNTK